jgi:hypothetical protein
MNEIYRYYEIFDLAPETSLEEVKKAYRDLVKVWHPDRFHDNQRLQKKANEKLSEINEAYEKITLYISQKAQIISEERIYEEQSGRDSQERKDSQTFCEVDLISLLGKSKDSIEVNHYISSLNERPAAKSYYFSSINGPVDHSRSFYYNFTDNCIDIIIENNILTTIFLYSKGFKGINLRQYRGSIPHDLNLSDERQTTKNKLGFPSKSYRINDWGAVKDIWIFPKYSISVEFNSVYDSMSMSTIALSVVQAVKEKEKGKWWQELWKGLSGEKV